MKYEVELEIEQEVGELRVMWLVKTWGVEVMWLVRSNQPLH